MVDNIDLHSMCFLCKRTVDVTDEHVFPQWLQRDYSLKDQFVLLKNGTKYKYSNITVPCCHDCNTKHLSAIENNISKAVRAGDVNYLRSNSNLVFIWLYKIMYGLNYKEMFLKDDIRDPLSKSIVCKKEFFEKRSYNLFPLYARDIIVFDGFCPYSLFVFKLSKCVNGNYFYADEPYKMFSAIALGDIGIVCSFQCDGYIENDIKRRMNVYEHEAIAPAEFGDFCAFVLHLKTRMKMLPNYVCSAKEGRLVFRIKELNVDKLYNDFDPKIQIKFTVNMFKQLFNDLMVTEPNGDLAIKYKSPFIYF